MPRCGTARDDVIAACDRAPHPGNKRAPSAITSLQAQSRAQGDFAMSDDVHRDGGVSRRRVLECMTWAGTGVLWTVAGGVPRSVGIVDSAQAAGPAGMTFLQISDSHVGFDK